MPQEGREVTKKNKGLECESPLPLRLPAKKELFWIIQPCPATQGGEAATPQRDPLPGLRVESPGREGRASLGSSATSRGCSDRLGVGWEGMRHPWAGDCRLPLQALPSQPGADPGLLEGDHRAGGAPNPVLRAWGRGPAGGPPLQPQKASFGGLKASEAALQSWVQGHTLGYSHLVLPRDDGKQVGV